MTTRPRRAPGDRFIFINRDGGRVFGDTADVYGATPKRLTPLEAVRMVQSLICDYYPFDYRKVARDDPAADLDVYRAAIDYPRRVEPAAVERDCEYVTTLAPIFPTCCFCNEPMEKIELWQFGLDAEPVAKRGERCCAACYVSKVDPVLRERADQGSLD
jgi:hypothetical protein